MILLWQVGPTILWPHHTSEKLWVGIVVDVDGWVCDSVGKEVVQTLRLTLLCKAVFWVVGPHESESLDMVVARQGSKVHCLGYTVVFPSISQFRLMIVPPCVYCM
jgi:hypothetical protein